jgi:hypothetical protein
MSVEDTLAQLQQRRAQFVPFREAVDADLERQRVERLATEKNAIRTLVLKAFAEGASMGQIKRAYNTTDHRTISDIIKSGAAEVAAIQQAEVSGVETQPEWFTLDGDSVHVTFGGDSAVYEWTEMEDGKFLFTTDAPLWNDEFTQKNKAVEYLDGKTESDSADARILAKYIRQS